jgi:hypothetical protein
MNTAARSAQGRNQSDQPKERIDCRPHHPDCVNAREARADDFFELHCGGLQALRMEHLSVPALPHFESFCNYELNSCRHA